MRKSRLQWHEHVYRSDRMIDRWQRCRDRVDEKDQSKDGMPVREDGALVWRMQKIERYGIQF